jgi:hypothetical protein
MFHNDLENDELIILSIDVGIIHLGISVISIKKSDYSLKTIEWVDLIDITQYRHTRVCEKECTLYHTKTISDWMDHLFQENDVFFNEADVILVERQPPGPFVAIEQLIFSKYRTKTQLISPRNVHSYLGITNLSYDDRKRYTVKIASKILPDKYLEQLAGYDRSHDITDSICMFLYWRNKKEKEYEKQQRIKRFEEAKDMNGLNVFEKLEKFRYFRLIR